MNTGPRKHQKRLTEEGLPIDALDWTEADWSDLYEAMEWVKENVSKRHQPKEGQHDHGKA